MEFFTGDLHLNHKNILRYANRPFASIEEHDSTLIGRHNSVVGPDDVVYNLGDVTFLGPYRARGYFAELNGQIRVLSNVWHHDRKWLPKKFGFSEYQSKSGYRVEILPPMVVLEYPKLSVSKFPQAIVLSHYPQARWERRHHGAWHLFGHSHGKYSTEDLAFDVGVDSNNFTPVSLDEVIIKMRQKQAKIQSKGVWK